MNNEQNKKTPRIFWSQTKTDGSTVLVEGNFEDKLQFAAQLCRQKRFEEGIYLLKILERIRPNDPAVLEGLAHILVASDQAVPALHFAERLRQLKPDLAISSALMGLACEQLGRNSEALQALDSALAAKFTNLESFKVVIVLAIKLNQRFSEVEKLARRILEREPDDQFAWLTLGHIFRSQGKTNQALDAFKRVIKLDPNSPQGQQALEFLLEINGGTPSDWSRN